MIDTCEDESECLVPSDSPFKIIMYRCKTTMSQTSRVDEKNNSFLSTRPGDSKYEVQLNSLNPCVQLCTTIQGKIKIKSTSKDLFGYMPLYYDKVLHQGVPNY